MKSNKLFFFFVSALLLTSSCKNDKKYTDENNVNATNITLKDVSELSFMEIYRALFTSNNGGIDVHGDLYGQEAVSSLTILEEDSSCGKALFIINNSDDKEITLAIEASFNLPGNPNTQIIRGYMVKPAKKVSIGNSILCYNSKEYIINRKVISAGFTTNQALN